MEKYKTPQAKPTGKRKLTLQRADEIRAEYALGGISVSKLAQREGVSYVTMKWLLDGRRYKPADGTEYLRIGFGGPLLEALRRRAQSTSASLEDCVVALVFEALEPEVLLGPSRHHPVRLLAGYKPDPPKARSKREDTLESQMMRDLGK